MDATAWERAVRHDARAAVEQLLVPGAVTCVVQPIVRVTDGAIVGYEALARMGDGRPPPDVCLAVAESVGLRQELELACLVAAGRCGTPPGDALLCVNASPALLHHPMALSVREELPTHLVVELTEQAAVDDYDELRGAIAAWKAHGVLIAVDDKGSGWSSLRHVVQLQPDFIKIDRSLISEVDRSGSKRALVAAMVAFGRESGCSVIAEGVERGEELAVLRDADVTLVQGYLLARPAPPWPGAADPSTRGTTPGGTRRAGRARSLEDRLAAATDAREACSAVADHLWRLGDLMPSAYLLRDGVLRCLAQRGLWQVLDGMPPGVGITGQVFATATTRLVPDVRDSPDYLEAIPGVVAELCVPVLAHGAAVGSVNVESYTRLSDGAIAEVHRCAALLGTRLEAIGVDSGGSANQRLVRHASALVEASAHADLLDAVVAAAVDVSGLDSAALVLAGPGGDRVARAVGPLAEVLGAMRRDELAHLGQLVTQVASCYTAGETTGAGLAATRGVRAAGGRTMVVVPLATRGRRLGHLVVAGTVPASLRTEDAERIELLGAHAAACLDNLAALDGRRDDVLTPR